MARFCVGVCYTSCNAAKNWTQLQELHLARVEVSRLQWYRNFSRENFVPWCFISNHNSDAPQNRGKKSTKKHPTSNSVFEPCISRN
jgi:hypothetical protein